MDKIENLIYIEDDKYSVKLMMTERMFPLVFLKWMKLVTLNLKDENCHDIIMRGLKILQIVMNGNYPAQAMILKDNGFNYLEEIFIIYPVEVATF